MTGPRVELEVVDEAPAEVLHVRPEDLAPWAQRALLALLVAGLAGCVALGSSMGWWAFVPFTVWVAGWVWLLRKASPRSTESLFDEEQATAPLST